MMMSPTAAKVNGCVIFIASSLDGSCRTCSTAPCDAPCPWSNTRDATRPVTIIAMTAKLVVFVMSRVFIGNSSSCRAQIFVTTITYKVRLRAAPKPYLTTTASPVVLLWHIEVKEHSYAATEATTRTRTQGTQSRTPPLG